MTKNPDKIKALQCIVESHNAMEGRACVRRGSEACVADCLRVVFVAVKFISLKLIGTFDQHHQISVRHKIDFGVYCISKVALPRVRS